MKTSDLTPELAAMISEMQFKFCSHATMKTCGIRVDVCDYKGLNLYAINTTRRNGETWGKSKMTYSIDEEKKEYKDLAEFLSVVKERTSLKLNS